MKLPTPQQCLNYFTEYKVPNNIRQHCLKVQQVALFLAKKLQEAGMEINLELIRAGALLHDLFKVAAIKDPAPNQFHHQVFSTEELDMREQLRRKFPGQHECQIAYEIFKGEFPELALFLLHEGDPYLTDKTPEETLVNYVDNRIFKQQIVSLEERFAYFAKVYRSSPEFWKVALDKSKKMEQQIFSRINLNPEQLAEIIKQPGVTDHG